MVSAYKLITLLKSMSNPKRVTKQVVKKPLQKKLTKKQKKALDRQSPKARVPGWLLNRLKIFNKVEFPSSSDTLTKTTTYRKVPGLNRQVFKWLFLAQQANRTKTIHHQLNRILFFQKYNMAAIKPVLPGEYNIYWLRNAYLIKLLLTKSYRAERMMLRKPAHGQRRWSNARTARRLNTYLEQLMRDCEFEVFGYRKRKYKMLTKLDEIRMKAKMRKKKKKKKYTKFKKFGERAVVAKKKKKTPWQ